MNLENPFGHTRTDVRPRHALLTPDGFVPSELPGWECEEINIVISPALGANLKQWYATCKKGQGGAGGTGDCSLFVYVLEGAATINGTASDTGGFAYLPPGTKYEIEGTASSTRLLFFEKRYEQLEGYDVPGPIFGNEKKIASEAFLGDPDAQLQTLLPKDLNFDMAVNIFVYQPGGTLPFVETHIMEHGMMIIKGQGVYRLDDRYYPVKEGDVIWLAPWCPQWYVSMGKEPSSYIYYKDVNRNPAL